MKNTRILSAILAMLIIISAFAGCGGKDEPVQTAEATDEVTTAAEKTKPADLRASFKDSLPSDIDLNGALIRFTARNGDVDTASEFFADSMNGEVVNDAVYERNLKVEERLNCNIEYIPQNVNCHGGFGNVVTKSVTSGSDDYDIVANMMYDNMSLVLRGFYLDLNSLTYLDFDMPWWNRAFHDVIEYNGRVYSSIGELAQTVLSGTFVMFFDRTAFELLHPDEQSVYTTVDEGGWTLDKLIYYCSTVYSDLNGNGEADEGDRYGHFFTNTQTLGADSFTGGCNIKLVDKLDDGSYVYNGVSERAISFCEKMYELLFLNNNTCRLPYNNEDIMKTMVNGETIFTTWMLSGVNYLRDMENDFGIIPMPKLDELQESYTVYTHDGSTAFSIPITCKNPEDTAAVLEALAAETYRTTTPAYLDTALKGKYSRDAETARMLDVIIEGIYPDLGYIYGNSLDSPIGIMRNIFASASACEKAASTLASNESAILKKMDKIITQYEEIQP